MFVDSIGLPDRSEEFDYLLSGAVIDDEFDDSRLPFGIFPRLSLQKVDLSKVTLFCGGSCTPKNLLIDIIVGKLGVDTGELIQKTSCYTDYLKLCYVRYSSFGAKDFEKVYISKREICDFLQRNAYSFEDREGLLRLFDGKLKSNSLCILQEPELSMSYFELKALVMLIKDLVKYSNTQFIISTNSPVILEIKDALIYDFDENIVIAKTWYYSSNARAYDKFFAKITKDHKREIKEE